MELHCLSLFSTHFVVCLHNDDIIGFIPITYFFVTIMQSYLGGA